MYGYTDQPWFRVAEKHSRGQLKLADTFGFSDWISEAGGIIMRNGKTEFQDIYQNHKNRSLNWSYDRLHNEQHDPELQAVHKKHYNSWNWETQKTVDYKIKLATLSSSAEFLNSDDRVDVGCSDMKKVPKCQ